MKLANLTTESLEEAIADQEVEYEDHFVNFESQLAELCEDDDVLSLTMETIVKLKKDIDTAEREKIGADDINDIHDLNGVEEENPELRQVIDHLSSENEAAHELRAKNTKMTESLRASEERNEREADIIESLEAAADERHDGGGARQSYKSMAKVRTARAHDDFAAPFENGTDDSAKISDIEGVLHHYKSTVSRMASDRSLLNNQLFESIDEVEDQDQDGVEGQIRSLRIQNEVLAQKLGGAVAEKELAMTTLTKIGAKMEEMFARKNFLSNIAEMDSQQSSCGASSYSGEESVNNQHEFRLGQRGRDPDASSQVGSTPAYNEMEASNYPSSMRYHDDDSTSHRSHDDSSVVSDMGSTSMSYEPRRQLEPESAFVNGNIGGGKGSERRNSDGREENDQRGHNHNEALADETSRVSGPQLMKVPGGEYFGQLNGRGQKHGNGKMLYDNGNEYEGQWKNNKRDGEGTTKYASGNVYTGEYFQNGWCAPSQLKVDLPDG